MVTESAFLDVIRASGVALEHIVCVDGAPDGTLELADLPAHAPSDCDFEATWRRCPGTTCAL